MQEVDDTVELNVDSLRIRELVAEDRAPFRRFFSEMGEESRAFFNATGRNSRLVEAFLDGEKTNCKFWAAVSEGKDGTEIAGYVFLWDTNTGVPWFGIAVADSWRGHHLGRRLLATAAEYCRDKGYGGILLATAKTNLRAQALYERCGFRRIGFYHNGEILYLLRFDK